MLAEILASRIPLRAPDPGKELSMSIELSGMINWCWAAAAVSVAAHFQDFSEQQCQVANRVLHKQCCPTNGACNDQQDFSKALRGHFKSLVLPESMRSLDFVKDEIDANRPVPIHMLAPGDGHILIICKYWVDATGFEWFGILDPAIGPMTAPMSMLRARLLSGYNTRIWNYSHITQ